jgi:hypothetical protein
MGKSNKRQYKLVSKGRPVRQKLTLPAEPTVALNLIPKKERGIKSAYICVLREKGWTLESIGSALNVCRERVRQLESLANLGDVVDIKLSPGSYPVPDLPVEYTLEQVSYFLEPSEKTLTRLKQLQPLAALVRSNSPNYRKEAEEFSGLLNQVINVEGVPASHVAKLLGVTHGAIMFRLVRYGYASTNGKSKAYQTIHSANRAIGGRNQNERII